MSHSLLLSALLALVCYRNDAAVCGAAWVVLMMLVHVSSMYTCRQLHG